MNKRPDRVWLTVVDDKEVWATTRRNPKAITYVPADELEAVENDLEAFQQREDEIIVSLGSKGILPSEIVKEIELVRDEIGQLQKALDLYGEHLPDCLSRHVQEEPVCTCGLDEALTTKDTKPERKGTIVCPKCHPTTH